MFYCVIASTPQLFHTFPHLISSVRVGIIPGISLLGVPMPLYEPPMRVCIRNHPDAPMGMWGQAGEVVDVNYMSIPHGKSTADAQQVYTVLFDGETKPMKVFEYWLDQDFGL